MRRVSVPCNAQLGAGGWRATAWLAVALFGLARRTEPSAARVVPAGGVDDHRAGWCVDSAASDRRRKNNQCDQHSHGAALVDDEAFSLCGSGLAAEEAARMALACCVLRMGLTPKVSGAGRSAATAGHQQSP